MTDMELFELLNGAGIEFTTRPDYCIYGLSLSDLADFIDSYFLPRPLFEDGTPVKVGDEFALHKPSRSEKVAGFCVRDDGSFSINGFVYDQDQRVKRPEQPDSWEQLEEDSKLYCCEYFGRSYKKCLGCQADDPNYHPYDHPYDCNKAKTQDIVRRAKALAGVDDEA